MKGKRMNHGGLWLAACAALALCLIFAPPQNTRQSMVRAVLAESGSDGWRLGLLYQQPEPSADAGEAKEKVKFCFGEGRTAAAALCSAVEKLPQKANFRLCDHVLLAQTGTRQTLADYETLVLNQDAGRTAARVCAANFGCVQLDAWCDEDTECAETLLQQLQDARSRAPRLYQLRSETAHLLPYVEADNENSPSLTPQGTYLTRESRTLWSENESQGYALLRGLGTEYSFSLDVGRAVLRRAGVSVAVKTDDTTETDGGTEKEMRTGAITSTSAGTDTNTGAFTDASTEMRAKAGETAALAKHTSESALDTFEITVFCTELDTEAGENADSAARAEEEIAALCAKVLEKAWNEGDDLLSLRAYAVQRRGECAATSLDPAKNACPKIRTGVQRLSSIFTFSQKQS